MWVHSGRSWLTCQLYSFFSVPSRPLPKRGTFAAPTTTDRGALELGTQLKVGPQRSLGRCTPGRTRYSFILLPGIFVQGIIQRCHERMQRVVGSSIGIRSCWWLFLHVFLRQTNHRTPFHTLGKVSITFGIVFDKE